MKKLFVSLPMRGYSDEVVKAEMIQAKGFIEAAFHETFELIDTLVEESEPEDVKNGCWYLGGSIQLLAKADLVVFHPSWKSASGCIIERAICNMYDIPFIDLVELRNPNQNDIPKEQNSHHLHLV